MSSEQLFNQDLNSTSGPAFDWVTQEVLVPDNQSLDAMKHAFEQYRNHGFEKLVKELNKVWPEGASWPAGEKYLRSIGWLPANLRGTEYAYEGNYAELIELLAHRLVHVAHRMFRDAQVLALIHHESALRSKRYTHLCISRDFFGDSELNPCGIRPGALISIEAGLIFLRQPAHRNPACECTADPSPL